MASWGLMMLEASKKKMTYKLQGELYNFKTNLGQTKTQLGRRVSCDSVKFLTHYSVLGISSTRRSRSRSWRLGTDGRRAG